MTSTVVHSREQVSPVTERVVTGEKYQRRMLPQPIIRVLIDDNPKRLGSSAYTRFTYYQDGITVTEYFKRGGRPEDIKWDEEHHYIKLEKYQYTPVLAARLA